MGFASIGIAQTAEGNGAVVLDPVTVEGQSESAFGPVDGIVATRSATGTKTDTPLIETPQSISVVTADQIQLLGAQTLGEALRYTPGVEAEPYGPDMRIDWLNIRGFDVEHYLRDGLRVEHGGFIWTRTDLFGVERLEVLKGPSSVLYGTLPPGGVVNYVSKAPPATPLGEITTGINNYGNAHLGIDVGGPVPGLSEFAYRIVASGRYGGTQTDHTDDNGIYLAPSLEWRPNTDTRLLFEFSYQHDNVEGWTGNYLPVQGTLWPHPTGTKIRSSFFPGEPGYDHYERNQLMIGAAIERRLGEGITWHSRVRYQDLSGEAPLVYGGLGFDPADPTRRTLLRQAMKFSDDLEAVSTDNQVELDFTTGSLLHKVLVGTDLRTVSNDDRWYVANGATPSIDVFNPVYGSKIPPLALSSDLDEQLVQSGGYVQDQIKFGNWVAILGGRYDWARSTVRERVVASPETRQTDTAFSGRAGLLYLFDNGIAPYASVSTSFEPSTDADINGKPFDPATARQFEVGVKYQPPGSRSFASLAVFDIRQQNVVSYDAAFIPRQTGEYHVQGLELEGKAELGAGWSLFGGYSYLNSEISKSEDPGELGNRMPSVPLHQASLWATYKVGGGNLAGLELGLGVRGQTAIYGDSYGVYRTPAVAFLDGAISYDLGAINPQFSGTRLQVNGSNLLDKTYVAACISETGCFFGPRRTIMSSLTKKW